MSEQEAKANADYWKTIQDENGVDLTLIRENLRRTPLERLRRADRGRRSALHLQEFARIENRRKHEDSLLQLLAIKRLREETGLR